jgi:hypothetical protein
MASKNYSNLTHSQQPPHFDNYTYAYNPSNSKFNPTMGIIIVALGSALIFVAFFTVYVRRCAIANAEQDSSNAAAGNPRSSTSRQPKGLDKSVVESLPVVHFKDLNLQHVVDEKVDGGHGKNENDDVHRECAVCLSEFETEDNLRLLPKCNHVFHLECIDVWFRSHSTCPLCRASLVPTTDVQQVPDAGPRLDQAESVVIEPEQEREGDGGQGVLQVPFEVVVVTIDGGDVGESAREQEQEAAQLAVPVAAPTRSGIATEDHDQKDTAWFALFRNVQSFKKAARVMLHERAGTSPPPGLLQQHSLEAAQTISKTVRKSPSPVNKPMQRSASLDGDGKSIKDFVSSSNNLLSPRIESQLHSVPAAASNLATMMNLPTTSNPDFQQACSSYSGLEFLRTGISLNSAEKAHLSESQQIRSNSEHWVHIELDDAPGLESSCGVGPSSSTKPVQQQLFVSKSPIISSRGTVETGRLERWSFLNLRNSLSLQR